MTLFTLSAPPDEMLVLRGVYGGDRVALSLLVAMVAGYIAMRVLSGASAKGGLIYRGGVLAGGIVLGLGVWAMHFIGMLAFEVCTPISYSVVGTALSMVPALLASIYTLHQIGRIGDSKRKAVAPALVLGAGIGLMHYGGMLSIVSSAAVRFDPILLTLSVLVAAGLSFVALLAKEALSRRLVHRQRQFGDLLSGVLFGGAISAMHYVGMLATTFYATPDNTTPEADTPSGLTWMILVGVSICIALALVAYAFARLKLMQEELKGAQLIIDSTNDVILSKDMNGVITSWNAGAARIFGYSREEMIGRNVLTLFPPEAHAQEQALMAQIRQGQTVPTFEAERVKKDGTRVTLSITISPLRDEIGTVIGATKIAQDVTQLQFMERLQMERDKAEAVAQAKTMFLANMSHELRTPLNAVIGFTDVLLDKDRPAQEREYLEIIKRSGTQLLQLVSDILDSAKLDRGAVTLEQRRFYFQQVAEDVRRTHMLQAEKKGIVLDIQLDPQLNRQAHLGDDFRIRQILHNLLSNAIKFTSVGRVGVSLEVGDRPGTVRVVVEDTGIGMPASFLQTIFEPFTQADGSTSRRYGGTGLGLTIAKSLVDLMGGNIEVQSAEGVGTTFTVTLPLALAEASEAADAVLGPTGRFDRRLKVLAVDDVDLNLSLLSLLFGQAHTLVMCGSGEQALQAAAETPFDIVLMDIQMPGMDGIEATRRLREQERAQGRSPVPVVAVTASVLDHDRAQAFAVGMNDFVMKPVSRERLFAILSKWVGVDAGPASAVASDAEELPCCLIDDAVVGTAWGGQRDRWLAAVHDVVGVLDQVVFTVDIGRANQQTLDALTALASDARKVGAFGVAMAAEACLAEWSTDARQSPSLAGLLVLTSAARECIEFAQANHLTEVGVPGVGGFLHMPVWLRERARVHVAQWREGFFINTDRELLAALRPYIGHQQHAIAIEALENFDTDELIAVVVGLPDPEVSKGDHVPQPL